METLEHGLRGLVDRLAARFSLPTSAAVVTVGGQAHYACTGGATPDSVYAIASLSKSFLTTALSVAVEEGRVELDQPVRRYLPDFTLADAYAGAHLTVRDALSHRSGLPGHDLMRLSCDPMTIETLVGRLKHLAPTAELRARFQYQNLMYGLCTRLLEVVTAQSYDLFVRERVLAQLGLTGTRVLITEQETLPGFMVRDGRVVPKEPFPLANVGLCSDMTSCVRDLGVWAEYHRAGGPVALSDDGRRELQTPQTVIRRGQYRKWSFPESDLQSYGLGLAIESYRGQKICFHAGVTDGHRALFAFAPDGGWSCAYLTNLDLTEAPFAFLYAVADLVRRLPEIDWCGRFLDFQTADWAARDRGLDALERTVVPTLPDGWERLCGRYENPGYGTLRVEARDGAPWLRVGPVSFPLRPTGRGWLVDARARFTLMFPAVFGADGTLRMITDASLRDFTVFTRSTTDA